MVLSWGTDGGCWGGWVYRYRDGWEYELWSDNGRGTKVYGTGYAYAIDSGGKKYGPARRYGLAKVDLWVRV